jgi:hypothetical protein
VVTWAVAAVAVITPIGLFVLAALWIITRSPTRVRLRLKRYLGLEIEGGGSPPTDPTAAFADPSASDAVGVHGVAELPVRGGDGRPRGLLRRCVDRLLRRHR